MRINNTSTRRHSLFGTWRWLVAGTLAIIGPMALANPDYPEAWGPAVETSAPLLSADDQDGERQTLDTLAGPKGLLLVFSRSVDW